MHLRGQHARAPSLWQRAETNRVPLTCSAAQPRGQPGTSDSTPPLSVPSNRRRRGGAASLSAPPTLTSPIADHAASEQPRAAAPRKAPASQPAVATSVPAQAGKEVATRRWLLANLRRRAEEVEGADDGEDDEDAVGATSAGASRPGLGTVGPQAARLFAASPTQESIAQRQPSAAEELQRFKRDLEGVAKEIPQLQQRLSSAINAEQEYAAGLLKRLYAAGALTRLQKDGRVLLGLRAEYHEPLFRSIVWRLSLPNSKALPYNRFREGDNVMLSRYDPRLPNGGGAPPAAAAGDAAGVAGRWTVDATVLELGKERMLVSLDKRDSDKLDDVVGGEGVRPVWRLDPSVLDVTAQRQLEAVRQLSAYSEPACGWERLLRAALVGCPGAAAIAQQPPTWVRDPAWRASARDLLSAQTGLNDSQRRAIATAMTRSATLWQGPPGTGKTRTLLALTEVLVRTAGGGASGPLGSLLVCADTNAAVDNLLEGLVARGVKVVRLGNPAKVRPALRGHTLEALAEATPAGQHALTKRRAAEEMMSKARGAAQGPAWQRLHQREVAGAGALARKARRDWQDADEMLRQAMKDVVDAADVLAATCTAAGDPILQGRSFRVVLVDEASQATEPSTLVALVRGAQSIVLAGDPRQLPPTIVSATALRFSLDVTLFERMVTHGLEPLLLDTQYRMHPFIAAFPSRHFYGGRLLDGVARADKPVPRGLAWPRPDCPMAVVALEGTRETRSSTDGRGWRTSSSKAGAGGDKAGRQAGKGGDGDADAASYRNLEEARMALGVVYALITRGDVGSAVVLTPYSGQVRCLEALLRLHAQHLGGKRVDVSTVDGYQGREADVVVFSTVRCNPQMRIGFVSDPRRLNVAITRPRRGLVVVGSQRTLSGGSAHWRAFFTWAADAGVLMPPHAVPPPPWRWAQAGGPSDGADDSLADGLDDLEAAMDLAAVRG